MKTQFLRLRVNEQIRSSSWLRIIFVCLVFIITLLILQQKLQNDQVELVQPNGTHQIETTLSAWPAIGQTFVPRQAGLRGVYIPLEILEYTGNPALTLHLRLDPASSDDIRTVTLPISELKERNLARFSFEPLADSFDTRYYFLIEPVLNNGEATIKLQHGGQDSYFDGALYLDGKPQDAQAMFFLAYDRRLILLDWAGWFITHLPHLFALIVMTLVPGAVLLIWLFPKTELNHIEWLALASGLSVAIYPVLLLMNSVIGLRLNSMLVIVLLGLGVVAMFYMSECRVCFAYRQSKLCTPSPPILLFWLIFILSGFVRIFVIRGQDIPLWGDSYHHTVIAQLMVDNGGLFSSWQPYAPIETFSYHFGFHAFVAIYHWLTGTDLPQAVLVTGQWLNLLTVLMAFLMGRQFGGTSWAGSFAALLTGLIFNHPMFYVNWGRYTQLAGQVILPAVMVLSWYALKPVKINHKLIILTIIGLAGLMLTHYRVTFFFLSFIIPLLLLIWLQAEWNFQPLWDSSLRLVIIVLGAFLVIIPWLWQVINSHLWQIYASLMTTQSTNQYVQQLTESYINILDYIPPLIVLLGIMGIIGGCWKRQPGIFIIACWGVILLVIAQPHLFNLPGTGIITGFAVFIAAYLPFSVLSGFVLSEISQIKITSNLLRNPNVQGWIILFLVIGYSPVFAQERLNSFNSANSLVTKPDLLAMDWIQANTSPEAVFWSNRILAYSDSTLVGTDAGWWIPYLTERKNLLHPMLYATEQTTPPDFKIRIRELYQQIKQHEQNSVQFRDMLKNVGVTHIYIGQRRGKAGGEGNSSLLDPHVFKHSPYYETVYQQDHVWIFAIK